MDKLIYSRDNVKIAINKIINKILDIGPDFVVISILNGGEFLAKKIFPCGVHHITTSSYVDNKKLPDNEIIIDMKDIPNIKDKTVVLIDDIYDTGNTLHKVNQKLIELGAKDIKNVVLVKRTGYHNYDVDIFAYGLEVKSDEFLVGCGMDCNGEHRDLPYIISIKKDEQTDA